MRALLRRDLVEIFQFVGDLLTRTDLPLQLMIPTTTALYFYRQSIAGRKPADFSSINSSGLIRRQSPTK